MQSLLSINHLTIGYPLKKRKQQVVGSGLQAQLQAGEMVCLLGANGTGKSTLMKTITGFLAPLDGEVLLNGQNIHRMNEQEVARNIAVVLTDKLEVDNATVEEIVGYGRSPYTGFLGRLDQEDKQKIDESIQLAGIAYKQHALFSSLSDGEKQKVTIAKALAQDTPIIILDEPTAFLDLPSKVEVMQLLRELSSKTGKAILMSTHDLDLALQMADKLWLQEPEKQLLCGTPEDLLMNHSFQSMFQTKGIRFDNKTGLFQVNYEHESSIGVRGHGFEYVMLRRAFSRKGIELKQSKAEQGHWVDVRKDHQQPFVMMENQTILLETHSIEELMDVFGSISKN